MSQPVPTLDSSGWVTGLSQKADRLFSYWITSQYSQTELFRGRVRPLSWLLQQYGTSDLLSLQDAIQAALNDLYAAYFSQVVVNVSVDPYAADDSMLDIRIDISVYENGLAYSVGSLLSTNGTILSKITPLTPGGPSVLLQPTGAIT